MGYMQSMKGRVVVLALISVDFNSQRVSNVIDRGGAIVAGLAIYQVKNATANTGLVVIKCAVLKVDR